MAKNENKGGGCGTAVAGLLVIAVVIGLISGGGDDEPTPAKGDRPPKERSKSSEPIEDLSEYVTVEEAVDMLDAMGSDVDEFCSSYRTLRDNGMESFAFESFKDGFSQGNSVGFSAREVFDEYASRC